MISHGHAPFIECSSKGDSRFSAFYARVERRGSKSIEELYQAAKVFEGGVTGLSWREAKGKRATNMVEVTQLYAQLWDDYMSENPALLEVIKSASGLADRFGQAGHCCQATELWRIRGQALGLDLSRTPSPTARAVVAVVAAATVATRAVGQAKAAIAASPANLSLFDDEPKPTAAAVQAPSSAQAAAPANLSLFDFEPEPAAALAPKSKLMTAAAIAKRTHEEIESMRQSVRPIFEAVAAGDFDAFKQALLSPDGTGGFHVSTETALALRIGVEQPRKDEANPQPWSLVEQCFHFSQPEMLAFALAAKHPETVAGIDMTGSGKWMHVLATRHSPPLGNRHNLSGFVRTSLANVANFNSISDSVTMEFIKLVLVHDPNDNGLEGDDTFNPSGSNCQTWLCAARMELAIAAGVDQASGYCNESGAKTPAPVLRRNRIL